MKLSALLFLAACSSGPIPANQADAAPSPCVVDCDRVGALCSSLCVYEQDGAAAIDTCQAGCAHDVATMCINYCPDGGA